MADIQVEVDFKGQIILGCDRCHYCRTIQVPLQLSELRRMTKDFDDVHDRCTWQDPDGNPIDPPNRP